LNQNAVWNKTGNNEGTYRANGTSAGGSAPQVTLNFSSFETLQGGEEDDIFSFQSGAFVSDSINAGSGSDTLDYSSLASDLNVNLLKGKATLISDRIRGFENVTGGLGDDRLIGDNADNKLDGGSGNNYIEAKGGHDTLVAGNGTSTVNGQA